ncbi:hypothetical protein KIN20_034507 [Parelaphostrongylus tenuis]|uniref:Uncharacterized protein n=1 Tax=Parelaphostrongylus tenuis TaxID=148309 RepID=A0AAD5WK37_PARTN|nr:hypothetical protein KIN20_034507 [Parelaphostrongylus tenuis]
MKVNSGSLSSSRAGTPFEQPSAFEYPTIMKESEKEPYSRSVVEMEAISIIPSMSGSGQRQHQEIAKDPSKEKELATSETRQHEQTIRSTSEDIALAIKTGEIDSKTTPSSILDPYMYKAKLAEVEKSSDALSFGETQNMLCISSVKETLVSDSKTTPGNQTDLVNKRDQPKVFVSEGSPATVTRSLLSVNEPLTDSDLQDTGLISHYDIEFSKLSGMKGVSEMTKYLKRTLIDQQIKPITESSETTLISPGAAEEEAKSADVTLKTKQRQKKLKPSAIIDSDIVFLLPTQSASAATTLLLKKDGRSETAVKAVVPTLEARSIDNDNVYSFTVSGTHTS